MKCVSREDHRPKHYSQAPRYPGFCAGKHRRSTAHRWRGGKQRTDLPRSSDGGNQNFRTLLRTCLHLPKPPEGALSIIHRPHEFLAEWTVAYSTRLRPRLRSQTFAWPTGQPRWWKATEIEPAAWSGEVATAVLLGHLKPNTAEIYVAADARPAMLRRLVKEQRLRPDRDGSVEILDQFWNFELEADQRVAPWPVLYADLLRVGNPRLSEAAALILAKFA
jgi:Transcriptional regulator, AbiEi antitoxin, Type IV TA system